MNIKVVDELHESLAEEAWTLYHEAFHQFIYYSVGSVGGRDLYRARRPH